MSSNVKKILAFVLTLTMIIGSCSAAFAEPVVEGTAGEVFISASLTKKYVNDEWVEASGVIPADTYVQIDVSFYGNPTGNVDETICAYGLFLEYGSTVFSYDGDYNGTALTDATIGDYPASGVISFGWAGQDGIKAGSPKKLQSTGKFVSLGFKTLVDVDLDNLVLSFLSSFDSKDAYISSGANGDFTVSVAPAITSAVFDNQTIYTDNDADDIKGHLTSITYLNSAFNEVEYTSADAEWDDIDINLPQGGLVAGQNTVTVSYSGSTCTSSITAVTDELSSIAITTPPTKLNYYAFDSFSTAGAVVTATYASGRTAAVTDYTLSYNAEAEGHLLLVNTNTVTFTYNGKTTTQAITVTAKNIEPIVTVDPTSYSFADGEIVPESITVSYTDNQTPVTLDSGEYSYVLSNNVNVGTAHITVSAIAEGNYAFDDIGCDYTITKATNEISDLSIEGWTYGDSPNEPSATALGTITYTYYGDNYAESENPPADAGSYHVVATADNGNNYEVSSASAIFTISPKEIENGFFGLEQTAYEFTNAQITPVVTTTAALVLDIDYTVAYGANKDIGTGYVTIQGIGNYTGTVVKTFEIVGYSLENDAHNATISGIEAEYAFTGSVITPVPVVTIENGTITLKENTDYTVSYTSNTAVGTATVYVTGTGNYGGTISTTFEIVPAEITDNDISLEYTSHEFTGDSLEPAVTVTIGNNTLVKDTDYTVSYTGNTNVTTSALVTVTGKGNYTGNGSKTFEITKVANTITTISMDDWTYGSNPNQLVVEATYGTANMTTTYSGIMYAGTDNAHNYESDQAPEDAGEYTVEVYIPESDNYAAVSTSASFKISALSINNAVFSEIASQEYTGNPITVSGIALTLGQTVLQEDSDFELKYSNNVNRGLATVVATGIDNYTGSVSTTFEIVGLSLESRATIAAITGQYEYKGSAYTPDVTVKLISNDDVLTKDSDYTVSYGNNVAAGTAVVTVKGINNYGGTLVTGFTIDPKALTAGDFTIGTADKVYTGSEQTQTITSSLTKDRDYTVEYGSNKNVGTATITVAGIGNYTDTVVSTFEITRATPKITLAAKTSQYTSADIDVDAATVTLLGQDQNTAAITYTYYSDELCTTTVNAHKNAGTYYVKANVAQSENYESVTSAAVALEIKKAPVTIQGVTANNREYAQGDLTAELVTGAGLASGIYNDEISYTVTGTFANDSIGVDKPVALTFTLTGDAEKLANYELSSSCQTQTTANIMGAKVADVAESTTTTAGITIEAEDAAAQQKAEDAANAIAGANGVEDTGNGNGLPDAAEDIAANPTIIGNAANAASEAGIDLANNPLIVVPRLDVLVKQIIANATNVEKIVLNITGKYQVKASGAAIDPLAEGDLVVTQPVEIEVEVPWPTAWIKHKTYWYQGTVSLGKAKFNNPHGFSDFELYQTANTVAKVNDVYFDTWQTAVNEVASGGCIILTSSPAVSASVSKETVFYVSGAGIYDCTIVAGTNYSMVTSASGEYGGTTKYAFTYNAPSSIGGGGGGGTVAPKTTEPSITSGAITITNPFTDVKDGDYYYTPVLWALQNGITTGDTETTFAPNAPCTRAQVVTFLYRAAGEPNVNTDVSSFSDVVGGSYYEKAVAWALANGITTGTGEGKFSPNDIVSRAQVVTFLCRFADGKAASGTNKFTDVEAGQYYADSVIWAYENGITTGSSETTFEPMNFCTRGQIVTFLYRYFVK